METSVEVVQAPDLKDKRRAFVLSEDRVGHYPEFRAFFERTFELERVKLATPGYVRCDSGNVYELVFIGRSGEPFPSGVEVNAIVPALEPLNDEQTDRDLWAILRWMVAGVGAPWRVEDFDATGRLYRIPAAQSSA